ncbi:MAG TPA: substrate-binding domain-containing protein [Hyphomicrobiaceae bacterium]|jgi:molybdate transport system substrate-binding protein|nr:substrate-binding domain-containing protein [Hyphomicrobiaceae bacterium]
MAASIRIFSTLAVQGAMPALAADYHKHTQTVLKIVFAPTNGLLARIEAGERADVAIMTREGALQLAERGVLLADSVVDVARSYVGLAVRAGTAKPDIASPQALKAALLNAQSIAYSRLGASGIFFVRLIEQLGIAQEVDAKATVIPSGFTAELAARGDVQLAVQQVSELMLVPGVDIVGPLPIALQQPAMFSAGVFANCADAQPAARFVEFLASSTCAPALQAAGLEPVLSSS